MLSRGGMLGCHSASALGSWKFSANIKLVGFQDLKSCLVHGQNVVEIPNLEQIFRSGGTG